MIDHVAVLKRSARPRPSFPNAR